MRANDNRIPGETIMIRTALAAALMSAAAPAALAQDDGGWSIIIHGGAGVIERGQMDADTEAAYREALSGALEAGREILAGGGSAMDAVEQVAWILEDDPLFNAGRGSVYTSEGTVENDASIMRASDMQAGAVGGVMNVRHPISLARAVMEHSPHVMLIADGASAFADEQGLERVDQAFYFTERRWQAMVRAVEAMGLPVPERPEGAPEPEPVREGMLDILDREKRFGTIGVVALDQSGELVAGTTTGGTTAKRWGRVGDTPIIGAGTYAANDCGVSATGTGEYFIRLSVAARICLLSETGLDGQAAADRVMDELTDIEGDGGIVALIGGQPVWSMNTSGMYRASQTHDGEPYVAIFDDE